MIYSDAEYYLGHLNQEMGNKNSIPNYDVVPGIKLLHLLKRSNLINLGTQLVTSLLCG